MVILIAYSNCGYIYKKIMWPWYVALINTVKYKDVRVYNLYNIQYFYVFVE